MPAQLKLTIELVPSTSWGDNLRLVLRKSAWDLVRTKVFEDAGNRCEICGGVGSKHPVECHETWQYETFAGARVQRLVGLVALCPTCHIVKHAGFAIKNGRQEAVIAQLMKVNKISRKEACIYIAKAFETWHKRSKHKWDVVIDKLADYLPAEESSVMP